MHFSPSVFVTKQVQNNRERILVINQLNAQILAQDGHLQSVTITDAV